MRKHQQKKILELIMTLNEAHAEMKRMLARLDFTASVKLLAQCQEFVIQIGSYIEGIAGEGTHTVALLEQCHEVLYLAAAQISSSNREGAAAGRVLQLLGAIEESVRRELAPDKIEVVFLPYKAAMWDSLESIWLTAKDDPGCDAYVIPIPYFDRLPNGGLGQMHYEGDQYPAYVPITDWQTYDIQANHPDIIFIHSPYDDGNTITSIHPIFYSKRLKDFTDLLAYVPYFVCVDDVPEHFCVCTGTMYAGKVFVQSEKIRQTYIRVFKEFEDQYHCHNRFGRPEDKFVAIGSPKFDKVIHSRHEDFTLPEEWRRLIAKPDGARKLTVLFNATIESALHYKEDCLKKLQDVLDTFHGREDAVLWWRPHPLLETVYRANLPELYGEYQKIVAAYQADGWGIFDDTPDLSRAIAFSDAYYGDMSSIVALYRAAGKPAMVHDPHLTWESGGFGGLIFENICDDGEHYWFTAMSFNGLFTMDKRTLAAAFVGIFPGEKMDTWHMFLKVAGTGGKLYFAPYAANEIMVYDKADKRFSTIRIREPGTNSPVPFNNCQKFANVVCYGKYVYFIGCTYPAIVRYDPVSGEVLYYDNYIKELRPLITEDHTGFFGQGHCIVGATLCLPALNASALVLFDMNGCTASVHRVGDARYGYSDVCFDGKDFWLSPRRDDPIVRFHKETGECKEYKSFPVGFSFGESSFAGIACYGRSVYLFPYHANMALRIGLEEEVFSVADAFQSALCDTADPPLLPAGFILAEQNGEKILAHTGRTGRFIEYDTNLGVSREKVISRSGAADSGIRMAYSTHIGQFLARTEPAEPGYIQEAGFPQLPSYMDAVAVRLAWVKAGSDKACGIRPQPPSPGSPGGAGRDIFHYCRTVLG